MMYDDDEDVILTLKNNKNCKQMGKCQFSSKIEANGEVSKKAQSTRTSQVNKSSKII